VVAARAATALSASHGAACTKSLRCSRICRPPSSVGHGSALDVTGRD
jgi:hypothetical protein